MNKTVFQFHNKTVTNLHDHEHVHLHGLGDWTSIIIAVIVVVGGDCWCDSSGVCGKYDKAEWLKTISADQVGGIGH